ncbi:MAG: hypothetical protein KF726_08045 [Anaerolineae bacterium]|nr:hypothetical protein [Anaerolineae bacterium]
MPKIPEQVNAILDSIGRSNVVRYTAIYFLIGGILGICGGCSLIGLGGLGGFMGVFSGGMFSQMGAPDEAQAASGALVGVGFGATIYGFLMLISAPLLIVAAWGLFNRKPWAHTLAVVAGTVEVVRELLGLFFGGGGILSLVFLVVSAFLVYVFYADSGIRAELGKPPLQS